MEPFNFNMFDDHVEPRQNAGYSTAAIVVVVALVVVVLLVWWQATTPANDVSVGDDPSLLLDREEQTRQQGNVTTTTANTMTATETAAVRNYTRSELSAIQARLETEEDYEAALQEVEELEADLATAYAQTAGATRQSWNDLRTQLDELEDSLRENSADSLGFLATLIQSLEEEVRVDEEEQ